MCMFLLHSSLYSLVNAAVDAGNGLATITMPGKGSSFLADILRGDGMRNLEGLARRGDFLQGK